MANDTTSDERKLRVTLPEGGYLWEELMGVPLKQRARRVLFLAELGAWLGRRVQLTVDGGVTRDDHGMREKTDAKTGVNTELTACSAPWQD